MAIMDCDDGKCKVCSHCKDQEIETLKKEVDKLKSGNNHLFDKPAMSQTPSEFLRSRNLKRVCDSDGFVGCERCQTMVVCINYDELKAGILNEIAYALDCNPTLMTTGPDDEIRQTLDYFTRANEDSKERLRSLIARK